jgi:hypothetical protein
VSVSAIAILLGLLLWFGAELITAAGQVGLAERVLGAAQASSPLVVVLSCCLSQTSCPDVIRRTRWHRPAALNLNFWRIR